MIRCAPPTVSVTKVDNVSGRPPSASGRPDGVASPTNHSRPPIITRTAATPMATPQGSPAEPIGGAGGGGGGDCSAGGGTDAVRTVSVDNLPATSVAATAAADPAAVVPFPATPTEVGSRLTDEFWVAPTGHIFCIQSASARSGEK